MLLELVANAGRMVTREDLQQKLWPSDTFVDFEVGLNSIVRKLRQALNDDADASALHRDASEAGLSLSCACHGHRCKRLGAALTACFRCGIDCRRFPGRQRRVCYPRQSSIHLDATADKDRRCGWCRRNRCCSSSSGGPVRPPFQLWKR